MIKLPIYEIGATIDKNWNTCVRLLEPHDDLPIQSSRFLYLDFETTSQKPKVKSIHPHKDCKILGVAVLFDSEPEPYYIPVRHCYLNSSGEYIPRSDIKNLSLERVYDWLIRVLKASDTWVNQNIKYDYHVLMNETGFAPKCKLLDTLNLAKLSEFVEQLNYSLDNIMRLFGIDITMYEKRIKEFLGKKLKDYGLIPPDHMAVYAGVDVLSCRYIHENIKIHAECQQVLEIENQILYELIKMEQIGIRVDVERMVSDYQLLLPRQKKRIERIKKLVDYPEFDPSTKECQEELFCNRLNWQIPLTEKSQQRYEQTGNEDDITLSFAYENILKHAPKNPRVAASWLKYQEDEKLLSTYIIPYLETHTDDIGLVHPEFIQIKRTGRMSCSFPNLQALPPRAKTYIIPYTDDYVLVEFDLNQIEFRVIVHYIDNKKCIEDYKRNPKTDFHIWVAKMCEIPRYPAKRVNFMLGYGGGKEKTVSLLSSLPDIIKDLTFAEIGKRALDVYETYHRTLPELKKTAYRAGDVLRSRGYVRTLYNRHRNIPKQFFFKAFNSICQGTAADFQKVITLRLRKFFNADCILHLLVHDCWLFSIKKERVNELIPQIKAEIERPLEGIDFSIPILAEHKQSEKNWRSCK